MGFCCAIRLLNLKYTLKQILFQYAFYEKKTMFYLTVDHLANAIDDFNSRDMEELSTVMQKAVARAEALEPEKEALFIIHDNERMSLVHYKLDSEGANFIQM